MITLSDLANKHNYLSSIPFIFDSNIWEYDIAQANINTLRAFDRLSEEEYYRLSNSPKMEREIVIGNKIRKDKTIQEDIYKGITEAKFKLMDECKLTTDRILRIANDSVYIINPINISNTNYKEININGNHKVTFVLKGYYTFFMNFKVNNILFFFGPGDESGYDIDIIGINDNKLYRHNLFLGFLCELINAYQYGGKSAALVRFNEFYNDYVNRNLPIDYYREFNSASCYRINAQFESFLLESIDEKYLNRLDIGFNLNILRTIYSYLVAA